jgi:hypothetical protein
MTTTKDTIRVNSLDSLEFVLERKYGVYDIQVHFTAEDKEGLAIDLASCLLVGARTAACAK